MDKSHNTLKSKYLFSGKLYRTHNKNLPSYVTHVYLPKFCATGIKPTEGAIQHTQYIPETPEGTGEGTISTCRKIYSIFLIKLTFQTQMKANEMKCLLTMNKGSFVNREQKLSCKLKPKLPR